MGIIRQNPYRTLGLLSNSTERELQKQIGIIKRFSEIGKYKSFDYDFEFLGDLSRLTNDVQIAASKIEQAHNKIRYSLFWFINSNQFDEIAFKNLQEENIEGAIYVWDKTLKESVTSKNHSSYHNLSTLYIALYFSERSASIENLKKGIELKGSAIHSEVLYEFVDKVSGKGSVASEDEVSKQFIDEITVLVEPHLNKNDGVTTKEFISYFDSYPLGMQEYISEKYTETPLLDIENKIEKTAAKRKSDPSDAEEYGEDLYKTTKKDAVALKEILGINNLQYLRIINNLAEEILQCGIDFYNKYRDESGEFDPGEDALRLVKYSNSLGATGQVKTRIKETIDVIQSWVDDAPEREKHAVIADDIIFITNEIQKLESRSITVETARSFVRACRPKLEIISSEVGSNDEFYLQICDAVVNHTLGILIDVMNKGQEHISDLSSVIDFGRTTSSVVQVTQILEMLDMNNDVRNRLRDNKKAMRDADSQMKDLTNRASSTSSSSDGCYIATMAYGDYEHPQVVELREFRDDILSKWFIGRCFIRFYYATSPHLVRMLDGSTIINLYTRKILDKFITWIKQ